MSRLSFEVFCIEKYADETGEPSNIVYEKFKKEGLLDMLRYDYDDLHGMGMEYMVQFCKKYLGE